MLHTAAKKKAPRPPVGTPLFSLRLSVYQSPLKKASKIFTDYAFCKVYNVIRKKYIGKKFTRMNYKKGESHMENMKVYRVYYKNPKSGKLLDTVIPSFSKEFALEEAGYIYTGSEIISAKEITDCPISDSKLTATLNSAGYGKAETQIITRALFQLGLTF